MFKRLEDIREPVHFTFNGTQVIAERGDTIAAALLVAGFNVFRTTPVSGAARGPFCLMGSCFDCLVDVDGASVQACMVPVQDGLVVTSPRIAGAEL